MTTLTVGNSTFPGSWEPYSNGYAYLTLATAPASGTLTTVKWYANGAAATSSVTGTIYAASGTAPAALLAVTSTVVGVVDGLNTRTLVTPLAVTNGQSVFIGLHVTVAAFNIRATISTGTNRYFSDPALPPDNPAPAAFTYAHRWAIWAEGTETVVVSTTYPPLPQKLPARRARVLPTRR